MDVAVDVDATCHVITAASLLVMAWLAVLDYKRKPTEDIAQANRVLENALEVNRRTQEMILKQSVMGLTASMSKRNGDVAPIFVANTSSALVEDKPLDVVVPDRGPIPSDPEDDYPDDISVGVLGGGPISFDVSPVPTGKPGA